MISLDFCIKTNRKKMLVSLPELPVFSLEGLGKAFAKTRFYLLFQTN